MHESKPDTAVLYNAACPVCRFEIDHYAAYSNGNELNIRFDDLNDEGKLTSWNVDADHAARRLHVRTNDELLTGIPAFLALWRKMPRYRFLARIVSIPGVFQLSCWAYDYVLAPLIYRMHLRRLKRCGKGRVL